MRIWADLQSLRRAVSRLHVDDADDEQASYDLAVSARRFSRRTRAEVDDKLSFSAVLMRAGEVDAANRLIEELERDVRAEEAALIEQMNEVRIARAMRRDAPTRARLARVLVTAMVGASMMAFSAIGMAVAGMVGDADRTARVEPDLFARDVGRARAAAAGSTEDIRTRMRKVRLANADVLLSPEQLRMLERITTGTAGDGAVEQLLAQLQLPADLAAEVRRVLTAASTVAAPVELPVVEVPAETSPKKKSKKKAAKKEQEAPAEDGGGAPPGPPQPQPSPEPSPSPSPSEGGDNGGGGSDKGSGNGTGLPVLPQ
ncbi:MAG TPA: hypothetical protein VM573_01690 [Actinomycetota bacterium]|nr:hypothetical protein [Actinomycetota bacterium]